MHWADRSCPSGDKLCSSAYIFGPSADQQHRHAPPLSVLYFFASRYHRYVMLLRNYVPSISFKSGATLRQSAEMQPLGREAVLQLMAAANESTCCNMWHLNYVASQCAMPSRPYRWLNNRATPPSRCLLEGSGTAQCNVTTPQPNNTLKRWFQWDCTESKQVCRKADRRVNPNDREENAASWSCLPSNRLLGNYNHAWY